MKHRKASVDLADAAVPTGTSFPLSRNAWKLFLYAVASLADHWKSVPSRHMRWRMTASFLATATLAFLNPMRLDSLRSAFAQRNPFDIKLPPSEDAKMRLAKELGDLAQADARFEVWLRGATLPQHKCQ